jgi:putative hydrolase of the HAD superfamily
MDLSTVFFDIGGTVETFRYDRELRRANTPVFRQCFEKAGISLDLDADSLCDLISNGVGSYQKWNRQSLIELPGIEIWSQYVFKGMDVPAKKLAPVAEELCYIYETRYFLREMRPEVPEVLHKLKEMGLRIGCISNTLSLTQVPSTLRRYGILEYFNPVVLSSDFGHRKPDPSIFYHAARILNLPTGGMAYVGDKINRDILGAVRSGFRLAVKIDHEYDDGEVDLGATPHARIETLLDLIPILEKEMAADRRKAGRGSGPGKIKGIFFDAGNILYHKPRKGRNIKRFIARHKLKAVTDVRKEKRKLKELAFQGVIDRFEFYEKVIRLYGVTDPDMLAEGITALVRDATTVEIIAGVPETLKALKKKGYILGIISDTATPIQEKMNWFTQGGFGNVFDSFISSKELGTRKPAPVIYEEAFKRVGLKVEEAVFVGHKASEIKGARDVGLKTIAFNYDKNARANVYIEKFPDLLEVGLLKEK